MRFIRSRSLSTRLYISHVLVGTLTALIGLIGLTMILNASLQSQTQGEANSTIAMLVSIIWLYDIPDEQAETMFNLPEGYWLVVDEQGIVERSYNYDDCDAGFALDVCAPELATAEDYAEFERDGNAWVRVQIPTITGHSIISSSEVLSTGSIIPTLLMPTIALVVLSIPLALLLAWVTTGRLTRRLDKITVANQRFAEGEFTVRVEDKRQDDIGQLAQQFNSMADVITQNVDALKQLAERNAELAEQAESSAIQAERVRLSRDLHDSIAQALFSLATSTASLSTVIENDPQKAKQQAQQLAEVAEQAQMDLRAILVDLRPTKVIDYGLDDALRRLCEAWSVTHKIPVNYEAMLQDDDFNSSVEDAVYRIAQEALNNVEKHAQATEVSISLLQLSHQLILSVTDNGQGMPDDAMSKNGRLGVVGMVERARNVNGELEITSDSGQGTTVHCVVSLKQDKA